MLTSVQHALWWWREPGDGGGGDVRWLCLHQAWVVNRALVDTLEGFEQPILIAMAGAARDARTAAMALLQEDMDGKRAERAKLHRQLKREQPGQLEAELRAVGEAFFAFFSRLYLGRTSELEVSCRPMSPRCW